MVPDSAVVPVGGVAPDSAGVPGGAVVRGGAVVPTAAAAPDGEEPGGGGRDEDRRMYMAGGPNGGRLGCRGGDGAQRAVRLGPWAEYLRGRTGHEKLLHALRRAEVSV